MTRVDRVIGDVPTTLAKVTDALANRLDFQDNFRSKVLGPITTPGANVEFAVTHNLGVVPQGYIANLDAGGVVYDSRRSDWDARTLYLKCTVPAATVFLVVF